MMNNKVTVMPNQGMMDVIIMGCGSVEAAEDFCSLNGVAISDVPITGSVYKVPSSSFADSGTLQYLGQNGIVIGTLGSAPPCPAPIVAGISGPTTVYMGGTITLTDASAGGVWSSSNEAVFTVNSMGVISGVSIGSADVRYTVTAGCGTSTMVSSTINVINVTGISVILAPYLSPNYMGGTQTPATLGNYLFKLVASPGFINNFPLVSSFLGAGGINTFNIEHAYDMIAGSAPAIYPSTVLPMTSKEVDFNILYTTSDDLFIWNGDSTVHSVTFKDINGNSAECAPVIIMQSTVAGIGEFWIGDIVAEVIGITGSEVNIRITRISTGSSSGIGQVMTWFYDAVGGTPDPSDPTNPDKTIVSLPAGYYTFGVQVSYTLTAISFTYPAKSMFSIAIQVY